MTKPTPHRPGARMSTNIRTIRSLTATAIAAALVLGSASSAYAAQTKRVILDPVEPGKAYDIVKVVLKSQKTETTTAKVVVKHGREVAVGDAIDIWFNIDADALPDIHLVGDSFSEYNVFETESFNTDEDGKNITKRGCM